MNIDTLNELIIKKYCKIYGYSYRYFGDNVIITTNLDEWRLRLIETIEDNQLINKILVEHYNRAGNKTGKMQFHSQKYAYDIEYIFKNIISPHERYKSVYDKAFRIDDILKKLKLA